MKNLTFLRHYLTNTISFGSLLIGGLFKTSFNIYLQVKVNFVFFLKRGTVKLFITFTACEFSRFLSKDEINSILYTVDKCFDGWSYYYSQILDFPYASLANLFLLESKFFFFGVPDRLLSSPLGNLFTCIFKSGRASSFFGFVFEVSNLFF